VADALAATNAGRRLHHGGGGFAFAREIARSVTGDRNDVEMIGAQRPENI
jgi:hypothetical protein